MSAGGTKSMETSRCGFPGKKASVNLIFILMDLMRNQIIPTQALLCFTSNKILRGQETTEVVIF